MNQEAFQMQFSSNFPQANQKVANFHILFHSNASFFFLQLPTCLCLVKFEENFEISLPDENCSKQNFKTVSYQPLQLTAKTVSMSVISTPQQLNSRAIATIGAAKWKQESLSMVTELTAFSTCSPRHGRCY
jgi:hypothetical protein